MMQKNLSGINKLVAESREKRQAREREKQNLRRVGGSAMGGTAQGGMSGNSAMRMKPRDKRY